MYKEKFRVESSRRPDHAYNCGIYFVTICAKKRLQWFGEVKGGKMLLSKIGDVVKKCILEIPSHFPHARIEGLVIMPNHIHLLIEIVETQNFASLPKNTFGPQSRNLGSIIRGFKIGVKKGVNKNYPDFHWQPLYHDRIIRSGEELNILRRYMESNPTSWDTEAIPWHTDAASFSL